MKKGVILLNMGGPNNLDEVEVFLKNMFNDKNIITVKSDILRAFIAWMITFFRKKTAQENYRQLGGLSPMVANTKKLVGKLVEKNPHLQIEFAFAYTPPFCKNVLKKMSDVDELIVLPMYPHYSTTTVKSSLEDFYSFSHLLKSTCKIKIIKEFYQDENYNNLIIKLIKDTLTNEDAKEYDLIFSAHSLPQKVVDMGDVYEEQVNLHVDILKQLLVKNELNFNKIHLAYQSKLGPVKWLEPELGKSLENLKNKKVIIFPLSFTIDNSETDFELSIEYKEEAEKLNFKEYRVCLCPNDDDEFVETLSCLIQDS